VSYAWNPLRIDVDYNPLVLNLFHFSVITKSSRENLSKGYYINYNGTSAMRCVRLFTAAPIPGNESIVGL
jgi:hypothetical protein